jgi:ubiquinone/menaquinone biosynthesis C-methylase UbiE
MQRTFYNAAYARGGAPVNSRLAKFVERHELHRVDAVISLLPRGGTLLDVGCGDGTLLLKSAPNFKRLIGMEVADVQVSLARRQIDAAGAKNIDLVHANIDFGLPLKDAQFDVVTVIAVLGLIFDPIAAISELRRVLKPGGCLAIEVLNLVYLPRRVALLTGRLPRQTTCHGWEGGHLHNFTQGSIEQLLHEHGFIVQRVSGSGVFASMRAWWPAMLTGNLIATAVKT